MSGVDLDAIQARRGNDKCAAHADCYTSDIAALLALVREQQAAIERVRELHTEDVFRGHLSNGCKICGGGAGWPCPTIAALTAPEPTND